MMVFKLSYEQPIMLCPIFIDERQHEYMRYNQSLLETAGCMLHWDVYVLVNVAERQQWTERQLRNGGSSVLTKLLGFIRTFVRPKNGK